MGKNSPEYEDLLLKIKELEFECSFFKSYFDSLEEVFVYFVSVDLKISWINKYAAESLNREQKQLVNLPCYQVWHNRNEVCFGCPVLETFHNKKVNTQIIHSPDNKVYELHAHPVFDPTGALSGVVEFGKEITEKFYAKKEKKINMQRIESLLKISEYEFDSIEDLMMLSLNEALVLTQSTFAYIFFYHEENKTLELFSYSAEVENSCRIKEPQKIYHLDQTGCWGECIRQNKAIIINDYNSDNPLIKGTPEGHVSLSRFLSIPIFNNGKIVATLGVSNKKDPYTDFDAKQLGIMMDTVWKILEKQQILEELKIAKTKAEESDRLKTAFLSNISHEIRTPMNGILGFTELMVKNIGDDARSKEYASHVTSNANQLLSTINDLIEISKIQSNTLKTFHYTFDLNSMSSQLYEEFHIQSLEKTIHLIQPHIETHRNHLIISDECKIHAIFRYLLDNAFKFIIEGSIQFSWELKGSELYCFVKDTGIGISKEKQVEIFEEFKQAESGNNRSFGGVGLGLTIAKSYITALGGKIWLESEINRGTTFYFSIPINIKDQVISTDSLLENMDLHDCIILFLDSDTDLFSKIQDEFKVTQANFIYQNNFKQTIDYCRNHSLVSLIILDEGENENQKKKTAEIIHQFRSDIPFISIHKNANPLAEEYRASGFIRDSIFRDRSLEEMVTTILRCLQ